MFSALHIGMQITQLCFLIGNVLEDRLEVTKCIVENGNFSKILYVLSCNADKLEVQEKQGLGTTVAMLNEKKNKLIGIAEASSSFSNIWEMFNFVSTRFFQAIYRSRIV